MMTEANQPLRRIVFELPNEHVPELMATLGDFVLDHNIGLALEEAEPESTEPSLTAEEQRYHPDLITWVKDPESGEDIAAISLENLQNFAEEENGHPMSGTRFYNSVTREPEWMSKKHDKDDYRSMIAYDVDGEKVLRADMAGQLLVALQTGTMRFYRLRYGLTRFFSDFYDQLILSDAPSD